MTNWNRKPFYYQYFARFDRGFTVELWSPPCATVELISYPVNTEQALGILTRGYSGVYSAGELDTDALSNMYKDLNATALKGPMENFMYVFLLTHVSRAFTHQLVRTRIGASYVQESMRFLGHKGVYKILITGKSMEYHADYFETVARCISEYEHEIQNGVPSEDARGVLPTNILTSVFVGYTLSTLADVFRKRVCCQAQQGEWSPIMVEMRKLVRQVSGDRVANLIKANVEEGKSCGYGASFDRPCTWKNGVKE